MVIVVIHELVTFQGWLNQVAQLQFKASYAGYRPKCGQLTHHNSEMNIPHLNVNLKSPFYAEKNHSAEKRKVHHLALLRLAFFIKCHVS